MTKPMRLAVFDCDGTLIDGQAGICAAMDRAFAALALPAPDHAAVRRTVGLSLPEAARRLLPGADTTTHRAVVEAYTTAFRAARESGHLSQAPFAGIPELLVALHDAGWQLAVATGMSRHGLAHCLAANGLADLFVSLQTADDHPSKPHPAMLLAALEEAGAAASDAVMIGDTAYDMTMAREVGVRAIGVAWGYHLPGELRAAGASDVADSPAALARVLAGIFG